MNLIAIDIGNSSINIGFFIGAGLFVQKIDTQPLMSFSEYVKLININGLIKEKNIDKVPEVGIISSVVPSHTDAIRTALKTLIKKEPLIVSHKLNTGISFQIKDPDELGTDRLAASVGACELYGAPVAVIDFGTATTINFIGNGNVFKGGAIMPGIGLMKKSLFAATAQLPEIELSKPSSPLGKDTNENILSGIVYGTAGAVERIITDVEKAEGESFKVAATGGYSEIASLFLKRRDYIEPNLVLKGLKVIYERNA